MDKKIRTVLFLLAISAVVAMGLRVWLHPPLRLVAAQLLPAPKPMLQDFVLSAGDSKLRWDQLRGHWALVFFGYTSCPDVCPLELQKLGRMLKNFDEAGVQKKPLVVFVSVDPERDKPELLKKYVSYFHDDMIGVTGTNAELSALADFFGASFNRTATVDGKEYLVEAGADMPPAVGAHYLVNHSARAFIIDPEVQYVGSFAPPYDTAALMTDMEQLLQQ